VNKINDIIEDPSSPAKEATPLKSKTNTLGKENNGTPMKTTNKTEAMISLMMQMLVEVKTQTEAIMERQRDLEYLIEKEVVPSISEGFSQVRRELR
jgi:hypothetical protein